MIILFWCLKVLYYVKKIGLYIDANEKVGDNFHKLYEEAEKFDLVAIRGSSHTLTSSLFYSSGKLSNIFQEALNIYKEFDYGYIRLFPIGPHVITWVLRDKYKPGFDFEEKDGIAFFPYTFIRDEKKYKKVGSASWSKGFNSVEYSQGVEDNFIRYRSQDNKLTRYFYESNKFPKVNLYYLRDEFDRADSKKVLSDLEKIYKKCEQKKIVFQRLIWSKMYRFFARKNKHF